MYFILHSYIKDVVVRVLYQVSIVCSLRYSFKLLLYQSLTIYLMYLKRINNKEKCKWFFFLNKTKKEGEREREREAFMVVTTSILIRWCFIVSFILRKIRLNLKYLKVKASFLIFIFWGYFHFGHQFFLQL